MLKQLLRILLLLSVFCLFEKCAQVAPLTGGARDITPPKLLEAIPANKTLNFKGSEIILKFDEFVQLKALKNELLISPGLATEPEISAEGKKIRIVLKKEELLPNTTYRFYFGKSIADMAEGNAIQNFEYVFSTGSFIDSLRIKGQIIDEFTQKNVGDAIIGLYTDNENSDSLAFKKIPDYVCRSSSNGTFAFGNLPFKTFKVVGILDKNKNYKYDGESEKIAFLNEDLKLTSDTSLNLELFEEEPSRAFVKKTFLPYYGKALVIYNKNCLFDVKPMNKEDNKNIYEADREKEKDTITIYYKGIQDTLKLVVHNLTNNKSDTLNLSVPKIPAKNKILAITSNIQNGMLSRNSKPELVFSSLVDTSKIDWKKIRLIYKKDTARVIEPLKGKLIEPFKLALNNKIDEGISYNLKIDTAAFYDFNGKYNDSLNIKFKLQNKTELGKLSLKLLLNKKQSYIVQLLNEKNLIVKEDYVTLSLSSSNAVTIDFEDVLPGTYQVKILFDDNGNKKWDSGNYLLKKQPEKVILHPKQIKITPDWELEEEISIK